MTFINGKDENAIAIVIQMNVELYTSLHKSPASYISFNAINVN